MLHTAGDAETATQPMDDKRLIGQVIRRGRIVARGVGLLVAAALAFSCQAGTSTANRPAPAASSSADMWSSNVRTTFYEDGVPRVQVAAKQVSLERPRLLGPVRIGFLRIFRASDVVVETFAAAGADQRTPPDIKAAVQTVLPLRNHAHIAHAELETVTLIQHRSGGQSTVRRAERCWTKKAPVGLVCRDRSGVEHDPSGEAWAGE